jgi:hypothetical protein
VFESDKRSTFFIHLQLIWPCSFGQLAYLMQQASEEISTLAGHYHHRLMESTTACGA